MRPERRDSKRQQHTALQDNDATAKIQTEQFPLSLCSRYLPPPHACRCLMRLSCWPISLSISASVFLSPPSIKLLLVLSFGLCHALSSLFKITAREFIERCNVDGTPLSPPVSDRTFFSLLSLICFWMMNYNCYLKHEFVGRAEQILPSPSIIKG